MKICCLFHIKSTYLNPFHLNIMKSVTISVLLLYASFVALFSTPSAEKATNIDESGFMTVSNFTSGSFHSYSCADFSVAGHDKKKEYHIFFENRSSDKLKVAIRFKEYNGSWTTTGFETLAPGEKKLMGLSDEQTYFYYASTQRKLNKREWKGRYKFALGKTSANKLAFKRQEIWECYDSNVCNTFAVFQ